MSGIGFRVKVGWRRVQGVRFGAQGSGIRLWNLWSGLKGVGCAV